MREEKRQARMQQIEAAAYELLNEVGYDGASMLAVAKRAKASNETMYRWYGDKNGLFQAMVDANAETVRTELDDATTQGAAPLDTLARIAPVLLGMLLGDRAIALNRAAAADASGALGRAIAERGREEVLPLIEKVLAQGISAGALAPPTQGNIGALFLRLLVGDQQIRRAIGVMAEPSVREIEAQAEVAMTQFYALCGVRR